MSEDFELESLHAREMSVASQVRHGRAAPIALGAQARRAGLDLEANPFWGPHDAEARAQWCTGWIREQARAYARERAERAEWAKDERAIS